VELPMAELVHVESTEDDGAGGSIFDDGGVVGRDVIAEDFGTARSCRLAAVAEDVLRRRGRREGRLARLAPRASSRSAASAWAKASAGSRLRRP
jgi:hypothetical protein